MVNGYTHVGSAGERLAPRSGWTGHDGENVMTKQNEVPWEKKPLMSRIAAVMYPGNTDQVTRDQMQKICDDLKKKSPQQAKEEAMKSQSMMGVAVRTKS
jgi:hypothetical protein